MAISLARKLQIKSGAHLTAINAPSGYLDRMKSQMADTPLEDPSVSPT